MSIKITGLSKRYKNGFLALDDINLEIGKGVYGLLGENGAGKTTLMRILLGLMQKEAGSVKICGNELNGKSNEKIRSIMGYLPQEIDIYPSLTVRDTLEYLGGLSGLDKIRCKERVDYYLETLNLTAHQKHKNKQLSGGMKRRVGLAQAMIHNPKILIVDEPTAGLDPEERIRMRNFLVSFAEERTVLFSTHVVEDLTATSEKIGILKKGKLIYDGKIKDLLEETKGIAWSCSLNSEEDYRMFENKYKIVNKQVNAHGIWVKFISKNHPEEDVKEEVTTLEDAYIYKTNNEI